MSIGVQPGAGLGDRGLGEFALVIARELGEAAVKALGDAALGLAGEDGDQARIEAARDIGADRHVAAQMQSDDVVEQLDQAALEVSRIVLVIDVVANVPVAPDAHPAILDGQRMARHQLLDAAKQRGLAERVLEGQILGKRRRIGLDFGQERQQRLRLGGEDE